MHEKKFEPRHRLFCPYRCPRIFLCTTISRSPCSAASLIGGTASDPTHEPHRTPVGTVRLPIFTTNFSRRHSTVWTSAYLDSTILSDAGKQPQGSDAFSRRWRGRAKPAFLGKFCAGASGRHAHGLRFQKGRTWLRVLCATSSAGRGVCRPAVAHYYAVPSPSVSLRTFAPLLSRITYSAFPVSWIAQYPHPDVVAVEVNRRLVDVQYSGLA